MRLLKVDGHNGIFFTRNNWSNNDRGNVICYLYWFSNFTTQKSEPKYAYKRYAYKKQNM